MDDKLDKDLKNQINQVLTKNLEEFKNALFSDNILCCCYFLKYLETYDDIYFDKFSNMFSIMNIHDKQLTLTCINTYLKKNKDKNKNNKTLTKSKNKKG